MKKITKRIFLTALLAPLALGLFISCTRGSADSKRDDTSIKELVYPLSQTRELETFNILKTQLATDAENLTNLIDGLLETDPWGNLLPAIAEKWGSNDGGLTWTFNIRKGVQWVDMNANPKAECNANDWATALEWILNFHKNESANTSMLIEMISGAGDYYNWTKTLSATEAKALRADPGSRFRQMVGIEIPDKYTIVYHCIAPKPYFATLAFYQCLYPMSQAMIDELGGPDNVSAMNNTNMWYNGCYTMTTYIHRNEKVFTKNPLYWDKNTFRFDTVTIKMVDSTEIAYQLYQSGEVDYTGLSESTLNMIYNNPDHPYNKYLIPDPLSKYSYHIHFNFNKKNKDGTLDWNWNTAVANTAFRRAWYYGLNLVNYWKRANTIDPFLCENNFYTMKGLVNTSDGTEYTELVRKELGLPLPNGKTPVRLDAKKFAQYKQQAMRELSALGVTFPVKIDHYVSGSNQNAVDTATILKQMISDCMGDDFMVLQINTYVSNFRQEIANPSLHAMLINGWGADYGDPVNFLGQETYLDDNAYYSAVYSKISNVTQETLENRELLAIYREYTRLVKAADAITTDLDARYRAFAKAEAYMLDNALVVPCYYSQGMVLGKIDNTSRRRAMYGIQNMKFKGWRTNVNGITTAEAAANAAKHAEGKGKK